MRQGKFLLACRLFQKSLTAYELLCERNPGLIFDTEYYKNRQHQNNPLHDVQLSSPRGDEGSSKRRRNTKTNSSGLDVLRLRASTSSSFHL